MEQLLLLCRALSSPTLCRFIPALSARPRTQPGHTEALINAKALPQKAIGDSLRIAMSAVHGLDYPLTWNYSHIDNAETKPIVRKVCLAEGYAYPEICTPQELMGVDENG